MQPMSLQTASESFSPSYKTMLIVVSYTSLTESVTSQKGFIFSTLKLIHLMDENRRSILYTINCNSRHKLSYV